MRIPLVNKVMAWFSRASVEDPSSEGLSTPPANSDAAKLAALRQLRDAIDAEVNANRGAEGADESDDNVSSDAECTDDEVAPCAAAPVEQLPVSGETDDAPAEV